MSERTLQRALEGLGPVRNKLVVVGGTAHSLFPLHDLARGPAFELLSTEDIDFATPLELGRNSGCDSGRDLLHGLEQAGFHEQVRGGVTPAYRYLSSSAGESYLQFIAPRAGNGEARSGDQNRGLRFSGINAEKLSHVDILLYRPWTAPVQSGPAALRPQVVNPIAFLLQKLLILPGRGTKRPKDLLYIFDTLSIFADSLHALATEATHLSRPLSKNARTKIRRSAHGLCFKPTELTHAAAAIAAAQRRNPPAPSQIAAACELGLQTLLADLVPGL